MEALLSRFRAAHAQVLGVSVDSIFSHANWARDLGGVSFPLLADFEPKGAVGRAYGVYLEKPGIDDRATIIIDSSGIVRYASSVTPSGQRNMAELLAQCEQIDRSTMAPKQSPEGGPGLPPDAVLYIKSRCGYSRATLLARDNLHLEATLRVCNVSEDESAKADLVRLSGKEQAPCLVLSGEVVLESNDIIKRLVQAVAPI